MNMPVANLGFAKYVAEMIKTVVNNEVVGLNKHGCCEFLGLILLFIPTLR